MAFGIFHKMNGLGNDFVMIDARENPVRMTPQKARAIADRKTGIGCDQLIIIEASATADCKMTIFNADGGIVESCGNASRCLVSLLGHDCRIETAGGIIAGKLTDNGVTVDMGLPRFEWQDIPLAFAMDTAQMPLSWDNLHEPAAINVGNPHVVFFVSDIAAVDLATLGPIIEHDAAFPQRVNVNVASVGSNGINLQVWERGVGLTRACGTGACATAVAAIRQKRVQSPVAVHLPGGTLSIAWQQGGPVIMTGPTSYVYRGEVNWDQFI